MKSNRLYNIPFWSICSCLVLGGVFSSTGLLSQQWIGLGVLVFAAVLVFFKNSKTAIFTVISCVLFLLLGAFRHQLSLPENQKNHILNQNHLAQPVETIIVITGSFKDSKKWKNYKASVKQINGNNMSGSILLKVKKEDTLLLPKGESYVGIFQFQPLKKQIYPYGFNYTNYLLNQNITHQIWVSRKNLIQLPENANSLLKTIGALQLQLNKVLKSQRLDAKVIQLTQALVLGNKKELDIDLSKNFAAAGVIHVLAISGLHIGIIYMVFLWLLKQFLYPYRYRVLRSLIVLLLLWAFAWFSGASDSALRATTMFSCFEISRLLLRKQHPLNALFLSVFVLFLVDPKILFSVGFQLSVTAVASIIIGVPKLQQLWEPKHLVTKYVWGIICVSLCAQIGLLPLSLYYFHQFPLLFLVANIPVMIGIPLIMGYAILIVVGGYFLALPEFVFRGYNFTINLLISFVNWIASFESLVVRGWYISEITVLGCYVVFAFLRWWYANPKRGLRYLFLPLASLIILVFIEINSKAFKKEVWLLDNYKNTTIIEVLSKKITVFSEKEFSELDKNYKIKPLLGELHCDRVDYVTLKQSYYLKEKQLLIINDTFIPSLNIPIDILLISNSPKINFDRLLEKIQPSHVIFASDNTSYLVKMWEQTCVKHKIKHHSISTVKGLRLDNL